ncbi:hypothetical protein [Thiomicrorhabdus sp.]|uniref:hypothetical protein n=1 Tax=Thiomicrorhabdus sp. TaxID=2039724 RepID=UPI003562ABE5
MLNSITPNSLLNRLFDDGKTDKKDSSDLSNLIQAKQKADALKSAGQTPQDSVFTSDQAKMAAARMQQIEQAYQYSETMSLQLTTREGDTVSVDFRQLYAQYQSERVQQQAEQGPQGVRYFESRETMEMTAFEERLAFSVDGELNEDELQAVFKVFEQVDSLANDFYGGNVEAALQKAMELNIDSEQLSGMQLNLTQTTAVSTSYKQAAMAQYEALQNQGSATDADGEKTPEAYGVSMSDLPPYLQKWQDTVERLDQQFENAQNFVDELMAKVAEQRFPDQEDRQGWLERLRAFHDQLSEWAGQNQGVKQPEEKTSSQVIDLPENSEKSTENVKEKAVESSE